MAHSRNRVCATSGCPAIQPAPRCPRHTREADRSRGSTTARGYGTAHQKARARWQQAVQSGGVHCARCHTPIQPGQPWDLGHDDQDRTRYTGPEHTACNRATAGRASP